MASQTSTSLFRPTPQTSTAHLAVLRAPRKAPGNEIHYKILNSDAYLSPFLCNVSETYIRAQEKYVRKRIEACTPEEDYRPWMRTLQQRAPVFIGNYINQNRKRELENQELERREQEIVNGELIVKKMKEFGYKLTHLHQFRQRITAEIKRQEDDRLESYWDSDSESEEEEEHDDDASSHGHPLTASTTIYNSDADEGILKEMDEAVAMGSQSDTRPTFTLDWDKDDDDEDDEYDHQCSYDGPPTPATTIHETDISDCGNESQATTLPKPPPHTPTVLEHGLPTPPSSSRIEPATLTIPTAIEQGLSSAPSPLTTEPSPAVESLAAYLYNESKNIGRTIRKIEAKVAHTTNYWDYESCIRMQVKFGALPSDCQRMRVLTPQERYYSRQNAQRLLANGFPRPSKSGLLQECTWDMWPVEMKETHLDAADSPVPIMVVTTPEGKHYEPLEPRTLAELKAMENDFLRKLRYITNNMWDWREFQRQIKIDAKAEEMREGNKESAEYNTPIHLASLLLHISNAGMIPVSATRFVATSPKGPKEVTFVGALKNTMQNRETDFNRQHALILRTTRQVLNRGEWQEIENKKRNCWNQVRELFRKMPEQFDKLFRCAKKNRRKEFDWFYDMVEGSEDAVKGLNNEQDEAIVWEMRMQERYIDASMRSGVKGDKDFEI